MSQIREKLLPFLVIVPLVFIVTSIETRHHSVHRTALNQQLQDAIDRMDARQVALALFRGADPNGEEAPGYTALMHAIEHHDTQSVKVLLANGADMSRKDHEGKTAIRHAHENHDQEIVDLLRKAGATE